MKYLRNILMVLALLLTAFALPTATQAGADVSHYRYKGNWATAYIYIYDECSWNDAWIGAYDKCVKPDSKPEVQSGVSFYGIQYNWCTGEWLYYGGFTELEEEEFQFDKELTWATLNATISVSDDFGNTFDVEVEINWTGFWDIRSGRHHDQYYAPGYHVNSRSIGRERDAQASGTVSGGPFNFTLTDELAILAYSSEGVISIDKH